MKLSELIDFIDHMTGFGYKVDGGDAVELALAGEHGGEIVQDILSMIAKSCGCLNGDCDVVREKVVNAMGPIRLKFMADDAPVDGLRIVEKTVLAIDEAFDVEALKKKGG